MDRTAPPRYSVYKSRRTGPREILQDSLFEKTKLTTVEEREWEEPVQPWSSDVSQVSGLVLPGIRLQFGQRRVDPEPGARLHRVVFVVLSAGQRRHGEDRDSEDSVH